MFTKRRDHPLRAEAEALLGRAPKLSRGAGLYYGSIGMACTSALLFQDGDVLCITPEGARAFDAWAMNRIDAPDALGKELALIACNELCSEELAMLEDGIKLLELGRGASAPVQFERRLRNLCAEILRTCVGGGGLRACWACLHLSNTK